MTAYAKTKIFYISLGFWLFLLNIVMSVFNRSRLNICNGTFYAKLFVLLLLCFLRRLNTLRGDLLLILDMIMICMLFV